MGRGEQDAGGLAPEGLGVGEQAIQIEDDSEGAHETGGADLGREKSSKSSASSNAAPWVALVKSHPQGRAEVVASGVTTNLRAAVWSLAWRSDAETPAAPLVLEYVGPKDYKDALAHLRGAMRSAGVAAA